MDNEIMPMRAELDVVRRELQEKTRKERGQRAAHHAEAAKRIKSSLWETNERLKALQDELGGHVGDSIKKLPSTHRAELLLDRHLTKKEKLLGTS